MPWMEILVAIVIVAEAVVLKVLLVCGGASFLIFIVILAAGVSLLPHEDHPKNRWFERWPDDFILALAFIPPGVAAFILLVDRSWMR